MVDTDLRRRRKQWSPGVGLDKDIRMEHRKFGAYSKDALHRVSVYMTASQPISARYVKSLDLYKLHSLIRIYSRSECVFNDNRIMQCMYVMLSSVGACAIRTHRCGCTDTCIEGEAGSRSQRVRIERGASGDPPMVMRQECPP